MGTCGSYRAQCSVKLTRVRDTVGITSTHHSIRADVLSLHECLHDMRPYACANANGGTAQYEGRHRGPAQEDRRREERAYRRTNEAVVVCANLADVVALGVSGEE